MAGFGVGRLEVASHPCRHSALTFADLTTFAHFSVSSTTMRPNSRGEVANGAAPSPARRDFIPGSAMIELISLLSLATISPGVRLGAAIATQADDSNACGTVRESTRSVRPDSRTAWTLMDD